MRTPKPPRVPEKVEQAQIVALLRSVGARVWVLGTRRRGTDYQGTMMTPGVPDVVAFVRITQSARLPAFAGGEEWRQLWVEVKAVGGRLRPEQATFRDYCQKAWVAHVVGGLDAVLALLVEWGVVRTENVPHYRRPKNTSEIPIDGV